MAGAGLDLKYACHGLFGVHAGAQTVYRIGGVGDYTTLTEYDDTLIYLFLQIHRIFKILVSFQYNTGTIFSTANSIAESIEDGRM
jgi:hypothetical protein